MATFWERAARSVDPMFSLYNVFLVISNLSFEGRNLGSVCDQFLVIAYLLLLYEPRSEKTIFAYAKTKTQISFTVTVKLISAFVFATRIVQSLYFLYPKFRASSHLVWLYSPVCLGPGRKPRITRLILLNSFHGILY